MCMTVAEMNKTMEEIKSLKLLKEETEDAIKNLERKVIEFLEETEACQTIDKKGEPVLNLLATDKKPHMHGSPGRLFIKKW